MVDGGWLVSDFVRIEIAFPARRDCAPRNDSAGEFGEQELQENGGRMSGVIDYGIVG
jgi:hypothetical protein